MVQDQKGEFDSKEYLPSLTEVTATCRTLAVAACLVSLATLALLSAFLSPSWTSFVKEPPPVRQQCAAKALARAGRSAEFPRLQKPLAHRGTACNLLAPSLNPHLSSMTVESGSSVEVVKSPQDARLYRYLELENGLRVLLISDPEMAGAEEDDEDDDDDYSEGSESDSDEPADDLDEGKRCRPEKPDKFGDTVRKRF